MKNESRSHKAILNIGSNFLIQILKSIFMFVTRTVFIYCLGKESLGLNSLYTNILSMLSMAELGIGTAINFSLYEPLAKKDLKRISSLMSFYKKAYRIIGFAVAGLGVALIPFLGFFVKNISSIKNAYIIYLLFLANTVSTYFISYKETLINADQKNYKLVKINSLFLVMLNVLQVAGLLIFKNFIVYLIIQLVVQFIQRVVSNIYITKQYKNINFKSLDKVESKDLKLISKNVKAMIFHKIGDYCINGTDNLIVSAFINVVTVGIYSNYLTILSLVTTFTTLFFNNITASLGNFVVSESLEKKRDIFRKMDFAGFIMYGFCSIILLNVFNDFISLWIGPGYCLNYIFVCCIVVSFYISGMRVAPHTIKSAAGMYDIDKYTPILQSVINLVVSVVLVKYIGIIGVVLGTIISSIVMPSWQRPYIVYKYILQSNFKEYVFEYLKKLLVLVVIFIVSISINQLFVNSNFVILFFIKSIVAFLTYLIFIFIFYGKTTEFKFFYSLFSNMIFRRKKCKKN